MPGTERFDVVSFLHCRDEKKFFKVQCKETKQFYAMEVVPNESVVNFDESSPKSSALVRTIPNGNLPFCMELRFFFNTRLKSYYVLDYIGETNLADLVKECRGFPESAVLFVAAELAIALKGLHDRGLSYKELNLANVMVDCDGHVVLWREFLQKEYWDTSECVCSLGIACRKSLHEDKRQPRDKPFDNGHPGVNSEAMKDDWQGLGVILYALLAGCLLEGKTSFEDVTFPEFISPDTQDFISGLLKGTVQSFEQVKCHPRLSTLDWNEVKLKSLPSPLMAGSNWRISSTTSPRLSKYPSLQNIHATGVLGRESHGLYSAKPTLSRTYSSSDLHSYSLNTRPSSHASGRHSVASSRNVSLTTETNVNRRTDRLGTVVNHEDRLARNKTSQGHLCSSNSEKGLRLNLSLSGAMPPAPEQTSSRVNFLRPSYSSAPSSPRRDLGLIYPPSLTNVPDLKKSDIHFKSSDHQPTSPIFDFTCNYNTIPKSRSSTDLASLVSSPEFRMTSDRSRRQNTTVNTFDSSVLNKSDIYFKSSDQPTSSTSDLVHNHETLSKSQSSTDLASLASAPRPSDRSWQSTSLNRSWSYSDLNEASHGNGNGVSKHVGLGAASRKVDFNRESSRVEQPRKRSFAWTPIPSFEEFRAMRSLDKTHDGSNKENDKNKYFSSCKNNSRNNTSDNENQYLVTESRSGVHATEHETGLEFSRDQEIEKMKPSVSTNPVIQELLVKYGLNKTPKTTEKSKTHPGVSSQVMTAPIESDVASSKRRLLSIVDDFLASRSKDRTSNTRRSTTDIRNVKSLRERRTTSSPQMTLFEEYRLGDSKKFLESGVCKDVESLDDTVSNGITSCDDKPRGAVSMAISSCDDSKERRSDLEYWNRPVSSVASLYISPEAQPKPGTTDRTTKGITESHSERTEDMKTRLSKKVLSVASPNISSEVQSETGCADWTRKEITENHSKKTEKIKTHLSRNVPSVASPDISRGALCEPGNTDQTTEVTKRYSQKTEHQKTRENSKRNVKHEKTKGKARTELVSEERQVVDKLQGYDQQPGASIKDSNSNPVSDQSEISITPPAEEPRGHTETSREVTDKSRSTARRKRVSSELIKKPSRKGKKDRGRSFSQESQLTNKDESSSTVTEKAKGPSTIQRASSLLSLTDSVVAYDEFGEVDFQEELQKNGRRFRRCAGNGSSFSPDADSGFSRRGRPSSIGSSFLSVRSDTQGDMSRSESSSSLISRGSSFLSNISTDSGSVQLDFDDSDDDGDVFCGEPCVFHEKTESEIKRNDSGLGDEIGVTPRLKKRWEDIVDGSSRQWSIVASSARYWREITMKKKESRVQQQQSNEGRKLSHGRKMSRERPPSSIDCPDCGRPFLIDNEKPNILSEGPTHSLICYKCQSHRVERKEAIIELVQTEINYGNDVQILKEEFLSPMQTGCIVSPDNLGKIFLNIQELLDVSMKFCKKIETKMEECIGKKDEEFSHMQVGKIFVENVEFFQAYELYCSKQPEAICLLESLQKKNEVLRVFLNITCRENPKCRKMDINSFLLAPVQRVMKYPLLLNRIRRATPRWHGDREDLKLAQRKVEDQIAKINSLTKSSELKTKKFNSNLGSSDSVDSSRLKKLACDVLNWTTDEIQLLMHGVLKVTCCEFGATQTWTRRTTKRSIETHLLFCIRGQNEPIIVDSDDDDSIGFPRNSEVSDATLLLLKRKNNGKYTLFRDEIKLRDCVVYEEAESDTFGLVHMGKETFTFTTRTTKDARKWIKHLKIQTKDQGKWRRRRNASANIMLKS